MFGTRQDEIEWAEKWGKENQVEITTRPELLTENTVDDVKGYDGISVLQQAPIDSEVIYQKLADFGIKIISLRSTGYDTVNLALAKKYHLAVSNVPGYSTRSIGELVLTQAMHLLRHIGIVEDRESRGDFSFEGLESKEIHQLTVGVIGVGRIGMTVASLFKALGSEVIGYDPYKKPNPEDPVKYVSYDELIKNADIITVHMQLTDDTKHMIDQNTFKQMKNSALFLNMARGGIVNTKDLIEALKNHEIAGAAIDTIEDEAGIFGVDRQNGYDNPMLKELIEMPNVSVTPHIAFYTEPAVQNMVEYCLEDSYKFLKGEGVDHLVNLD